MSTRRKSERTFAPVAALEQRALLAGNVTAKFVNTNGLIDVVITGDDSANSITITQTSLDVYTVKGLSTKINSKTGGTFTFRLNRFDDLRITMNGGNDYLAIQGKSATPTGDLDITDDLVISMGSGKDRVNLQYLEVKGDLKVNMGTGADKLNVKNTVLRGTSDLNGGDNPGTLNFFVDNLNLYGNTGTMNWRDVSNVSFKNTWY